MNLQEIYNKTKEHLLRQNNKARGLNHLHTVICAYRLSNGLKCAIGCHIPDELYSPAMEGKGVQALIRDFSKEMQQIFGQDIVGCLKDGEGLTTPKSKWHLLERLQGIHDSDYIQTNMWKEKLEKLALEFGLNP